MRKLASLEAGNGAEAPEMEGELAEAVADLLRKCQAITHDS